MHKSLKLMDDGTPVELERVEGELLSEETGQKSVKIVLDELEDPTLSPKPKAGAIRFKDSVHLAKQRLNVQDRTDNVETVAKPTSPGTKLRAVDHSGAKKKGAVLKRKNDESSPKSDVGEKSPKGVKGDKVSREKVAKLAKKFDRREQSPKFYSKMVGMFKKTEFDHESNPSSPQTKVKSPTSKSKSPQNKVKSPTHADKEVNTGVTFDDGYVNNYRADGTRAKDAELNRQKKAAATKKLLKEMDLDDDKDLKKKVTKHLLGNRTKKGISGMLLNKDLEDTMSVFGQYPVLVTTTSIILFVFFAELIFNKVTFNGRCVSKVLYPDTTMKKKAYHVMFGYSACEYNLQTKVEDIGFVGKVTADNGWPTTMVEDGASIESVATFDSPNYRVFNLFGAMDANHVRNYKENFRIFWSMFMHSGFMHMIFNLLAQTQILWIIEPDFGFARTLTTFIISGIVGNLSAAVFEPSFNVIGSSGCLFGMVASLIPYCIENWTVLVSPIYIFIFSIVIAVISLSVFNSTVSVYSHFGGWVGGFLWGFATMRNSFNLKDCALKESVLLSPLFKGKLTEDAREKLKLSYQNKRSKCIKKLRIEQNQGNIVHKLKKLTRAPVDYFKRGPYDILIRIVPLVLLVVLLVVLCCYLYMEPVYSKLMPFNEGSKLSQCCYLQTKGEGTFTKKVFWCFENYETASNFCKKETVVKHL